MNAALGELMVQTTGPGAALLRGLKTASLLMVLAPAAASAGTTTYTYDELGRLITTTTPGGGAQYSYDAAGNRVQQIASCPGSPTANPDIVATLQNTAVTFNPLTNDTDPNNYTLTVTGVSSAVHGSVTFASTSITYTPTTSYLGSDSFNYTISNGHGCTASAQVTADTVPPVYWHQFNWGSPSIW